MRSIERSVDTGLLLTLILLFLLQWVAVSLFARTLVEDYMSTRLEHDMEGLLTALERDEAGQWQLSDAAVSPVYQQPFSGHYFQIELPQQMVRSRSLWDSLLVATEPGAGIARVVGPDEQPLLMVTGHYRKQGDPMIIRVAEDLSPLDQPIDRFRLMFGLISLLALAGLIGFQRHVVRRGLAPLTAMRQQVSAVNAGTRERLEGDAPAEVQPLAREINRLLGVTENRLSRSRDAIGNLAHALKHPLSRLNQLVDETVAGEAGAEMRQQLGRVRELMDRELRRARVAGPGRPGQRFRPAVDVPPLIHVIERLYVERSLTIEVPELPDTSLPLDRDDLMELLGNLLDNAAKWARSRVRLSLEQEPGRLRLLVEDDGPGCCPELCGELLERGRRLDEGRPGHGIGLSIVSTIVADYDGQVVLSPSPALGGLRATVDFPLDREH